MAPTEQDVLLGQFIAGRAQLRGAWQEYIRRWFAASKSFRDADANRFVSDVVPVALGAQQAMASFSWVFQAKMLASLTGSTTAPAPVAIDRVTGSALRGVDPDVVYRRPFTEIYRQLADGKTMTEAVTAGQQRAQIIGVTDLQLVDTHTAQAVSEDPRTPQFFRRGLTGNEDCGLCVLASTQRYKRGNLLPIHPGCDCLVIPMADTEDPGHVLDENLLQAAHDAIAERFGAFDRSGRALDYRRELLVRNHGELGPVLTIARHLFTGPEELPSPASGRRTQRRTTVTASAPTPDTGGNPHA